VEGAVEILIAEDDRVTALKLQRALEKMGFGVNVARDGAEAWGRVSTGAVQLLITDWEMPEVDGLELCRRVRDRPDAAYTYVIMLTSRGGQDDRLAGLQAGADDYLSKPFDTGELVARLNVARRILTMQEQLRSHAAQLSELHAALERQNALLAERAATDGLTGLSNRRRFDEALTEALSFSSRQGHDVSLVLLDVDRFKAYNDKFGHQAGDEALRTVAGVLRAGARVHDVVARYGGEELALILPATDTSGALVVAERLRGAIASRRWPLRPITASLGVATTAPGASSPASLVEEADRALYHSKQRGRNRVTHYEDVLTTPADSDEPRVEMPRWAGAGSRDAGPNRT
jgi:diguanylate cyclase (GGDEF)-like protein